jgi:hypothetical protein
MRVLRTVIADRGAIVRLLRHDRVTHGVLVMATEPSRTGELVHDDQTQQRGRHQQQPRPRPSRRYGAAVDEERDRGGHRRHASH